MTLGEVLDMLAEAAGLSAGTLRNHYIPCLLDGLGVDRGEWLSAVNTLVHRDLCMLGVVRC